MIRLLKRLLILLIKQYIQLVLIYLVLLTVACISATPLLKNTISKIKNTKYKKVIDILDPITLIGLLLLSTAFLIDESFNPFLYFRF